MRVRLRNAKLSFLASRVEEGARAHWSPSHSCRRRTASEGSCHLPAAYDEGQLDDIG